MVAPPFYQQISGTVILCDLTFTTDLTSILSVSLSCKTLQDPSLPPATAEQIGQMTQIVEFYGKIGKNWTWGLKKKHAYSVLFFRKMGGGPFFFFFFKMAAPYIFPDIQAIFQDGDRDFYFFFK